MTESIDFRVLNPSSAMYLLYDPLVASSAKGDDFSTCLTRLLGQLNDRVHVGHLVYSPYVAFTPGVYPIYLILPVCSRRVLSSNYYVLASVLGARDTAKNMTDKVFVFSI